MPENDNLAMARAWAERSADPVGKAMVFALIAIAEELRALREEKTDA